MTHDVRETPEEVINTALCCAEGEAAIDEVDERAAREWLAELIAERDAFERDYTAVGERNKELHNMYFAALALAERREVQVKRLHMSVQFELNSLPTMREETRAAGLASVADQIERNREGLERIVKSVEALDDIAAVPPPASEGDGEGAG